MKSIYAKTRQMAEILGYSSDFLLNNRGIIFFEGEHFFTNNKRINWKIPVMMDWIENKSVSIQSQEILRMVS